MKVSILMVIMLIVNCTLSVEVIKDRQGLSIRNQKELAEMILAHLGYNTEETSQNIKQIIKDNKMSVLNAVFDVVLLVTTGNRQGGEGFELTKQFLNVLGKRVDNLNVDIQVGKSVEEVEKYVEENLEGKVVQQINIEEGQIEEIRKLLAVPSRRVLLETKTGEVAGSVSQGNQGNPASSYTFKFFFILVFIIVTFGILGGIAGMQNRKDTLLYAKFIADVGR